MEWGGRRMREERGWVWVVSNRDGEVGMGEVVGGRTVL